MTQEKKKKKLFIHSDATPETWRVLYLILRHIQDRQAALSNRRRCFSFQFSLGARVVIDCKQYFFLCLQKHIFIVFTSFENYFTRFSLNKLNNVSQKNTLILISKRTYSRLKKKKSLPSERLLSEKMLDYFLGKTFFNCINHRFKSIEIFLFGE